MARLGAWFRRLGRGRPTRAARAGPETTEARSVTLVEREGDLVHLLGRGPRGEIEAITRMTVEGSTLYLRDFDITGPGPGSHGVHELLEFARELGRQHRVRRVVVQGRTRTTGAGPGRTPRAIVIEVD